MSKGAYTVIDSYIGKQEALLTSTAILNARLANKLPADCGLGAVWVFCVITTNSGTTEMLCFTTKQPQRPVAWLIPAALTGSLPDLYLSLLGSYI